MRRILSGIIMSVFMTLAFTAAGHAQFHEPQRGSQERKAMLDAMRVFAEEELGAPVEFMVYDLRSNGTIGFAAVHAQRPGGGAIDLMQTPGAKNGTLDPEYMDGASMQALMRRSGQTWVAVNWAIGATDVWFAYGPYCRRYRAVIPDYCQGVD